jgi:hypothetical protein
LLADRCPDGPVCNAARQVPARCPRVASVRGGAGAATVTSRGLGASGGGLTGRVAPPTAGSGLRAGTGTAAARPGGGCPRCRESGGRPSRPAARPEVGNAAQQGAREAIPWPGRQPGPAAAGRIRGLNAYPYPGVTTWPGRCIGCRMQRRLSTDIDPGQALPATGTRMLRRHPVLSEPAGRRRPALAAVPAGYRVATPRPRPASARPIALPAAAHQPDALQVC